MQGALQLVFASSNDHTAAAFKRYCEFIHPRRIDFELKTLPDIPNCNSIGFNGVIKYLESKNIRELVRTVLVVDYASFHEESETTRKSLEDLFLIYPELTIWILSPGRSSIEWFDDENNNLEAKHTPFSKFLIKNLGGESASDEILPLYQNLLTTNPLFDPSSVRSRIKIKRLKEELNENEQPQLFEKRIKQSAAAIDEEKDYAYLHGYIAYRLGYSTHMVQSEAKLIELFYKDDKNKKKIAKIDIAFDDVFLNFEDKRKNNKQTLGYDFELDKPKMFHYSNLEERDEKFLGLKHIETRIFVTSGHRHVSWHDKNRAYMAKRRLKSKTYKTIYKPSGGIYNLLKKSGLLNEYWKTRKLEWQQARPAKNESEKSGHSASGMLMTVAEILLDRARILRKEVLSVPDCIHGAMLALEAQELLGFRTPTVSLEAISLRHEFEVLAECMFYGVEYNIDVKNRFLGIQHEVDAVSRWFHPRNRRRSSINTRMAMVTCIMRIFNENGQFDEGQNSLKHFRNLNRQWYFLNHPWLNIIRPLRWYIETLIGSFPLFLLTLFAWPLVFGSFSFFLKANFGNHVNSFTDYLYMALINFFALQPIDSPSYPCAHIFSLSLTLLGFIHLGIFISYLYTLISRK